MYNLLANGKLISLLFVVLGATFVILPVLSFANFFWVEGNDSRAWTLGVSCKPSTFLLTPIYVGLTVFGQTILGLLGATFVFFWASKKPFKMFAVIIILMLPYAIPSTVSYTMFELLLSQGGVIQRYFFPDLSPLNGTWSRFLVMVWVGIWQFFPFSFILILSAFLSTPRPLLLSAKSDGASHWLVFRKILIPIALPVILATIILRLVLMLTKIDAPLAFSSTSSNDYSCLAGVQIYKNIGSTVPLGLVLILSLATIVILLSPSFISGLKK